MTPIRSCSRFTDCIIDIRYYTLALSYIVRYDNLSCQLQIAVVFSSAHFSFVD